MLKNVKGFKIIQMCILLLLASSWYNDTAELPVLEIRSTQINSLLLHPDGNAIFLSSGSQILVWDIYKKQILQRYNNAAYEVVAMSLSKDGLWLAVGYSNGEVTLWNTNTFEVLHQFVGHTSITTIRIDSPSDIIAIGDHLGHVKIWDLTTALLRKEMKAHNSAITALDISQDGQSLLTASKDATAKIWDLNKESKGQKLIGHLSEINSACFLNSTIILTGSNDKTISAWNRHTGEITKTLLGHQGKVVDIKPMQGQEKFVSASSTGEIVIWHSETLKEIDRFSIEESEIHQMELLGNLLVPLHLDQQISMWDIAEQKKMDFIHISNSPIQAGQLCNSDNFILTGDKEGVIKKYKLDNGDLVQLFQGHEKGINEIVSSPDGKKIATASHDKMIKIWDSVTGELLHALVGHKGSVLALAFSENSDFLYSGGKDKMIKHWDLRSGIEIGSFKAHSSEVNDLIAMEDNRVLSVGKDRKIKIHHVETGALETEVGTNKIAISCAAYASKDSLVYVGDVEGQISIYHTGRNVLLDRFYGHTSKINSLTLTKNATYLLSGSDDKTANLWDLSSKEIEHTFVGHNAPVSYCSFGQDESTIVTTSLDKQIKVWSNQNIAQR